VSRPTPPGTGVIAPETSCTETKSTSNTKTPAGSALMQTSMTTVTGLKIGVDGLCPLEEQLHRRHLCERSVSWEIPGIWERERWDSKLVFGTQAQHLAARHKELEIRASFQQFDKQGCCRDDVFKVIQEQEPVFITLRGLQ